MSFEEFQNGHHGGQLGYRNRTSLAIWNFLYAPMPLKKYLLNPTNRFGADIPANMYIWEPYGQNLGIYPIRILHGPHIGFFAHIRPI